MSDITQPTMYICYDCKREQSLQNKTAVKCEYCSCRIFIKPRNSIPTQYLAR
ncbi:hypothetical protein EDEG_00856 [Edhazardia aedis USNM 41457]|uniref:DNA-directed RNA polymerase I, II, and III subunit RPABC4 n=1 Tax=Edhazardia aedis (strain USNM 41457) TaxID=1003232 RepID=J9DRA0_EDHAE|nr:hypothetical protein EDEG_00856 [Edhazardia aedis USNM 41457]|eukprot:EJW05075.1 hypothetical protein EDEG_00856 [Edhazardia aedis USNM 41457]